MAWRFPFNSYGLDDEEEDDRIYNIPLVPLKSPLYRFPDPMKPVPPFHCYNPDALCKVRDQGDTSFCWAYTICALLSDMISIRVGFKRWLSVADLTSCMPFQDNVNGGAAPETALGWMAATSFKLSASDDIMPVGSRSYCTVNSDRSVGVQVVPSSIVAVAEFIPSTQYEALSGENALKLAANIYNMKRYLVEVGPLYAAIEIYGGLRLFFGDRVYTRTSAAFFGGHAVVIIGYCDHGVDTREGYNEYGYWICRNSWGPTWSAQYDFPGYFAIRMGTNEVGIESRVGGAMPDLASNLPIARAAVSTTIQEFLAHVDSYNIIGGG